MGIDMKKISVQLLHSAITDEQLKTEILSLREFGIKKVVVLPCHVARVKQLLMGTDIQIGSVVDYPLGSGTMAKQAFETGELYRTGANEVNITANLENFSITKQTYQMLAPLSFGKGDLGFFVDVERMSEEENGKLALQLGRANTRVVCLGTRLSVEKAIYYLTMYKMNKDRQVLFQVNVTDPTLLELEMLFQNGANVVGINNHKEILPLINQWMEETN